MTAMESDRNGYAATTLGLAGTVTWMIRGYSGLMLAAPLFNEQLDLVHQCTPAPPLLCQGNCRKCPLHLLDGQ